MYVFTDEPHIFFQLDEVKKQKIHSCGQVMQDIFFEKQIPNMPFIFLT